MEKQPIPRGNDGPGFPDTEYNRRQMEEFAARQGILPEPEQQEHPLSQTIEDLQARGVEDIYGAIEDE